MWIYFEPYSFIKSDFQKTAFTALQTFAHWFWKFKEYKMVGVLPTYL